MLWKICLKALVIGLLFAQCVCADERRGGFVLAFDDGYASWINIIAPELAKVGGVATGYVNNQRIHSGMISFDDLRRLQNSYGWEIGTHAYDHFDPTIFIELHGMSSWIKKELEASVTELQSHGLRINSLVFPFNKYTKELAVEVLKRMESYRKAEFYPIAPGKREDGSIPGVQIGIGNYIPLKQLFEWIDIAHEKNQLLFLYGHEVLPDNEFVSGTVASVEERSLVAQNRIRSLSSPYLCLVPDSNRQIQFAHIRVKNIEGNHVKVINGDLTSLSKPGAAFIVGPCNAMRLSDFRATIKYAAEKLKFLTVHNAVNGR